MIQYEDNPPVLELDEKVLVVTRRLFANDLRRHFVGSVERYDQGSVRVHGYAFVHNTVKGCFVKRKNARTRVFPLDSHIILFVLPYETEVGAVQYEQDKELGLVATDGKGFKLELSEFNT